MLPAPQLKIVTPVAPPIETSEPFPGPPVLKIISSSDSSPVSMIEMEGTPSDLKVEKNLDLIVRVNSLNYHKLEYLVHSYKRRKQSGREWARRKKLGLPPGEISESSIESEGTKFPIQTWYSPVSEISIVDPQTHNLISVAFDPRTGVPLEALPPKDSNIEYFVRITGEDFLELKRAADFMSQRRKNSTKHYHNTHQEAHHHPKEFSKPFKLKYFAAVARGQNPYIVCRKFVETPVREMGVLP